MALRTLRMVLLASALLLPLGLMVSPADAAPQPPASTPVNCTPLAGSGVPCPTPDPATPYGGLDHFLCYEATADPFTTPEVTVQDQFGALGPLQPEAANSTATSPTTNWFCNPFQKTLGDPIQGHMTGPVYGVSNPRAHLLCFNDTGSAPGTMVTVTNQLGSATLVVGSPTRLCLPTWKFDDSANSSNDLAASGSVSPSMWTDPSDLALNHFQCYQVSLASGTSNNFEPIGADSHDQFDHYYGFWLGSPSPYASTPIPPVPNELCAPSVKTVLDAAGHPLTPPSTINSDGFAGTHLLCFQPTSLFSTTASSVPAQVKAGNQFSQIPMPGTPGAVPSAVSVSLNGQLDEICIPSYKAVVPPPNTPEAPIVLLFPLAAAAIGAAGLIIITRRRRARFTGCAS